MKVLALAFALALSGSATLLTASSPSTSTPPAASPPGGDPILEVFDDSLTTYLASSATPVQDIRPRALQRGVNLDGALRAGSTYPMAIGGNPFGTPWAGASAGSVDLSTGVPTIFEVDLALPSRGLPWVIGRSYNSRQETSGASHRDSDGFQGANWFQTSQPEIVLHEHETDDDLDVLYLVYGADRFVEFKRVDIEEGTSDSFKATNGAAGVFEFTAGAANEPDTYTLTDQNGNEWTFFGFDGDAGAAAGQFWKSEDNAGNVAFAGDATTGSTAISSGFATGKIQTVFDADDRRYTYSYTTLDSVDRLTEVKAETKTGGTWASPSGVATVAEVDYTYYSNESHGDIGDLKQVIVTRYLTDSGITQSLEKYYRYYEGAYHSTNNPGYPHGLKYVFGFEGVRNFDWTGDTNFNDSHLTETNANLEAYAEAYFEYDTSHRANSAWFNGRCGCSGASNGIHLFSYEDNTGFTPSAGYTDDWASRTIVGQPDGSFVTQHFDEVGQALTKVVSDDNPAANPAPQYWVTFVDRDSAGMVSAIHTPANEDTYTHSSGDVTSKTGAGLIHTFQRETTGSTTGYELSRKWQEGTSGTAYLDGSRTYAAGSITVGDADVIRPVVASATEYTQAVTSGTTGANTTSFSNTFYSSSLALEKVVVTNPTVSTGNNGSGSATTASRYFDQTGRVTFTKSPSAIIGYTAYTTGQATTRVQDADTTQNGAGEVFNGVTIPTGFSSSGSPLHRVTTMTYDAQGRSDEATAVDGQVFKTYYSRLADHRGVTLRYADFEDGGTPKYFGPVSYAVTNQAGSAEATATVSLSGNETTTALTGHIDETDDDPITAADLGTVVRLQTSVYQESGYTMDESRAYFDVPGSGDGAEGTNYDGTFYAYDSMGRKIRTLEPSGTIYRTDFDEIGRAEASWIGTNDNGAVGGSASGTNNMTKTSATVFDAGADGGNSLVTKRTGYVDSSTGHDTDYTYDVRGRALLVVGPTAPYAFSKYDNLGRSLATGLFSATGSITVGSDDPTTETANRIALSQTFYDELGRAWKSQRHEIDASDGSDDDNLQSLTWFDADGRVVKADGSQLAKTAYDRIGRVTHRFTLASDNDTAYADADDVTGDVVLNERQTVFEDDGDDVVLELSVDRFHSDYGGGQTTGALDTNADSDRLLVTAANLKGRPQITTHWHDRFGRTIDTVRYGNNGGSNLDRDGLSAPASSESNPRRTMAYRTDGALGTETDPLGRDRLRDYDDLGRLVKEVSNYDAGVNSGNPSGADDNVTVLYGYTDGLQTSITADVPSGGTDQVTTYSYGTAKGASAGDSKIATGHLLQEVEYPDSVGASDTVTYAYDARGAEIWREDQAGNVIERVLDGSGRETARKVTTLDGDFDGAVRRIESAYDALGRVDTVIQFDAATAGDEVDGVAFSYDGWGNVETFEQDRDSEVGASGSVNDYEVSYTYAKATSGRNTVRKTSMTLPSGNVIDYSYASAPHDDDYSRVTNVWDGVRVVGYIYLGVGQVVRTWYLPADTYHDLIASGTTYAGLDGFNRVARDQWTRNAGTAATFYDTEIRYDAGGNILSATDNIHSGFDVAYAIDDTDRLTRAHEGTLSGGSITSPTRDQQWTLDHLGNWDLNQVDLDGDGNFTGTDEEDDDRTHNDVNELTARDIDDDGTDDYTLAYDEVGNLIDDGESYKYVWDAFGRMRKILDRSDDSLVAELRYNGLGFWIAIHEDTDDDDDVDGSDLWYYHAYDERWRQVATFRSSDSAPKEEFVAHQAGADGRGGSSYIDLVAWRDKDANSDWTSASDGTLEERSFYCQNYHADVVARVDSAGTMLEWVKYSAYGVPFGLPGGDADSDGDCDSADITQIDAWIASGPDDVRGDIDLDGDVDASDKTLIQAQFEGISAGRDSLSSVGCARGFGGLRQALKNSNTMLRARYRNYSPSRGAWASRDPLGYTTSPSLYGALDFNPLLVLDPSGLSTDPTLIIDIYNYLGYLSCCYKGWQYIQNHPTQFPGNNLGFVACCDGEPTVCTNYKGQQDALDDLEKQLKATGFATGRVSQSAKGAMAKAMYDCTKAHEQLHKDEHLAKPPCESEDGTQFPDGTPPNIKDFSSEDVKQDPKKDSAQAEVEAHKLSARCWQEVKNNCASNESMESGIDKAFCKIIAQSASTSHLNTSNNVYKPDSYNP